MRDEDSGRPRGSLDTITWLLIGATALVVAAWFLFGSRSLALGSIAPPALASAGAAGLGLFYRHLRPDPRLSTSLTALAQLIAFSSLGVPLSYLLASLGRPLWDATFLRWDLALGLDWRAHLAWMNDRPALMAVLGVAYGSILPQMIVTVVGLGLSGRREALERFAFAYVLSGLVTIVISGAMPAMALFVHLGLTAVDYPNLEPIASHVHVAAMQALRSGGMPEITLVGSEGIITFPSFHATLSVIFAAALWSVPWLRWPGLALNAAMLVSTPLHGGHYYVDVLAGVALAVLALLAAGAVTLRRRRPAAIAQIAAA